MKTLQSSARELVEADDSDRIKAIIISGAGDKAFAAGTDIGQFTDFTDPKDGQAYEARMEMVISKIETCKVPVIAALHGAVTGGGLVIASAVHVRIASAAACRWYANCPYPWQLPRCIKFAAPYSVIRRVPGGSYDLDS